MGLGILNLTAGATADVASDVYDEYFVRHINLALVHIVQHLLGAFRPDFIVSGMAEESDADDDIAFKGEALLRFKELFLETCAPTAELSGK